MSDHCRAGQAKACPTRADKDVGVAGWKACSTGGKAGTATNSKGGNWLQSRFCGGTLP